MVTIAGNFVILKRDDESYVFVYDDNRASRLALYEVLRQFAGNRLLNLTWSDAWLIARRVIQNDRRRRAKQFES